ncbi:RHS repeat-associated core domain-containing protein [Chryseobacterium indologenes]|uniref:RHS repeat-associated core domain-containing protein n=1 Tax=Chryseobacterium indologenes TaxID=253 RepID=UPI001BCC5A69|nr:RHS repeat-associated core domain-containing protein [Chryseobacterium indologenes]
MIFNTLFLKILVNYQYNGKELQKETGWNDYGVRMYMADIGRWGIIDSLAETNRRFSPYAYALISSAFIDPDGRKIKAPNSESSGMAGYQPSGGMLNYIGPGDSSTISAFIGAGDGMGRFFAMADGGGGPPKSNTGPGVIERFISWLFGGKKKAGRLEVGQIERVSMSYGQTALFGLIRNANVNANGESPLEQYRTWRDYPLYNEGENWLDRFARNVNSSHMEILQDEGSGGGLMFGGYGRTIAAAEEVSMMSKIAAEAEAQGFKSLNSGIDPAITAKYLEQMMNGTFNKPVGVAGFRWEGKFYLNDGNHRMSSAIQYKILTGDYKYMDILMNNAKWDNANPVNYGKIYKFPVKPTR